MFEGQVMEPLLACDYGDWSPCKHRVNREQSQSGKNRTAHQLDKYIFLINSGDFKSSETSMKNVLSDSEKYFSLLGSVDAKFLTM